jgi:uncharacterized protein (DUF58 family)
VKIQAFDSKFSKSKQPGSATWKNFSVSLLLLAMAMLAALYSSNAAQDGRVVASGTAAVAALAVAIWVGLRFVPRLAANVDWSWLPFASHYRVTGQGWIYCGAVIVVVFAAVNTSNNLLYMVLSAQLAVILISGLLSEINFHRIKIELEIPRHCFAGQSFPVYLRLVNQKPFLASFSLRVEPLASRAFQFTAFYVPCVHPESELLRSGEATLSRRGQYRVSQVCLVSTYPFGFFTKYRNYSVEAECICYPTILPQDRMGLDSPDILGTSPQFVRGLGNDLYTIRDYLPSDSARHVHWKASAKSASLKTREYAAEESQRVTLALDRYGDAGDEDRFETLISYAASLAVHLIAEGVEVAVVTDEWHSGYCSEESQMEGILNYLALVSMSNALPEPSVAMSDDMLVLSLRLNQAITV